MSSLPVRPFPLPNPAEGMGSAVNLLVHFRLKRVPLVILIWSLFKYVKHTAPYFDSGSIFFKLYQEVMERSKLYSVDYVGAHLGHM